MTINSIISSVIIRISIGKIIATNTTIRSIIGSISGLSYDMCIAMNIIKVRAGPS